MSSEKKKKGKGKNNLDVNKLLLLKLLDNDFKADEFIE